VDVFSSLDLFPPFRSFLHVRTPPNPSAASPFIGLHITDSSSEFFPTFHFSAPVLFFPRKILKTHLTCPFPPFIPFERIDPFPPFLNFRVTDLALTILICFLSTFLFLLLLFLCSFLIPKVTTFFRFPRRRRNRSTGITCLV